MDIIMSFITLFLLAIALAMDAFAVSITNGISIKNIKIRHAVLIALFFGVFQAAMPVLGWLLGKTFSNFIANYDHWVVFAILAFIGIKMIHEALRGRNVCSQAEDFIKIPVLFALAIATSIDALAVGISFSFMKLGILFPVIVIGIITFILSFIGVYIGKKLGNLFGRRMEIAGGLILIIIGLKILLTG
jgi:manganese efflux pump family protein